MAAEEPEDFFTSHWALGTTKESIEMLLKKKGFDVLIIREIKGQSSSSFASFHVRAPKSCTPVILDPSTWPLNTSCCYFQNVRRGIPINRIWGKESSPTGPILGAPRRSQIYAGNFQTWVTEEDIREMLSPLKLTDAHVESLPSAWGTRAFKIDAPHAFQESLLSPTTWPSGITFHYFRHSRKQLTNTNPVTEETTTDQ